MRIPLSVTSCCADAGRWAAGVFLIASAMLKLFLPDYNSSEFFAIDSPLLYSTLIVGEVVLGLFLLLRSFSGGEGYVAALAFLGFSAVQLYYVSTGEKTCSCLGSVSMSPVIMLSVDLGIALLLLVYVRTTTWPLRFSNRWLTMLFIAVLCGYAVLETTLFRGPEMVSAFLTGRPHYAVPQHLDFGSLHPGETADGTLTVHNRSGRVLDVVGASELPIVFVGDDLPITVHPQTQGSFRIVLTARGKEGRYVKRMVIYCVDDGRLTGLDAYLSLSVH